MSDPRIERVRDLLPDAVAAVLEAGLAQSVNLSVVFRGESGPETLAIAQRGIDAATWGRPVRGYVSTFPNGRGGLGLAAVLTRVSDR